MNWKDVVKDNHNKTAEEIWTGELSDKNRPRISLRHLHTLRKMREQQKAEHEKHLADVHMIYGDEHNCKDGKECDTCKDRDKQERKNAKTALKSIKAKDKESEEVAHSALGRVKKK